MVSKRAHKSIIHSLSEDSQWRSKVGALRFVIWQQNTQHQMGMQLDRDGFARAYGVVVRVLMSVIT